MSSRLCFTLRLTHTHTHTHKNIQILVYDKLAPVSDNAETVKSMLSKVAVLKLNGGLGTSMGCVGPKSAIVVRDDMTFLDMCVHQNKVCVCVCVCVCVFSG